MVSYNQDMSDTITTQPVEFGSMVPGDWFLDHLTGKAIRIEDGPHHGIGVTFGVSGTIFKTVTASAGATYQKIVR